MKKFALFCVLVLAALPTLAQTPPESGTVTLTTSPTNGTGSVPVTLNWNAGATSNGTPASSCSGSWTTGILPASGSVQVTATKTTTYTVTCTWNGLNVVLTWTAPTMNTDGSAINSAQLPLTYTVNASSTSGAETVLKSG